jgi:hypothetical protein
MLLGKGQIPKEVVKRIMSWRLSWQRKDCCDAVKPNDFFCSEKANNSLFKESRK